MTSLDIIKILDIIASILIVLSLNLVVKGYKWWLLYIFSNIFFIIVVASKGLMGMTVMGSILMCTGIKNYIVGRKNG